MPGTMHKKGAFIMYELQFAYIHVAGNDNSLEKLLFPECDNDYFEIEYKNGRDRKSAKSA